MTYFCAEKIKNSVAEHLCVCVSLRKTSQCQQKTRKNHLKKWRDWTGFKMSRCPGNRRTNAGDKQKFLWVWKELLYNQYTCFGICFWADDNQPFTDRTAKHLFVLFLWWEHVNSGWNLHADKDSEVFLHTGPSLSQSSKSGEELKLLVGIWVHLWVCFYWTVFKKSPHLCLLLLFF